MASGTLCVASIWRRLRKLPGPAQDRLIRLEVFRHERDKLVPGCPDLFRVKSLLHLTRIIHLLYEELRIPQYVAEGRAEVMKQIRWEKMLDLFLDLRGQVAHARLSAPERRSGSPSSASILP